MEGRRAGRRPAPARDDDDPGGLFGRVGAHLLEVRQANDPNILYNPLYFFDPRTLARITGLEDTYVNPEGEIDASYNVWSMGWYQRGAIDEETGKMVYWNFWEGTAKVFWGRWW